MIRIVTDSASDITQAEAEAMGILLVPLPILFEGAQDTGDDFDGFYRLLAKAKELPRTSQPSPAQYLEIYEQAEKVRDDVVVIALSSGLSGTYDACRTAAGMTEYDRIFIIDSRQATIAQRMLVDYAVRLRAEGRTAAEIADALTAVRDRVTVCGVIDTLTYLKKGGRIPPALALIGNALYIKPIVILRNTKLEMLGRVRGFNNGKKFLYSEYEKEPLDTDWPVYMGYTRDRATGERFMQETVERYGLEGAKLFSIGGVIGTHVGPGCIAIAFVRRG